MSYSLDLTIVTGDYYDSSKTRQCSPKFMHKMKKNQVNLNRKMLSQLVILDPAGFEPLMKYE
ncbi:unnamed protein product [Bathycoccus prasinos]